MYVIVVGGGKVGYYLTRTLLTEGFEVTLMERKKSIYDLLEEQLGEVVMLGDGTDLHDLHQAGARRADLLVSVTGNDEANLVACQVGKRKFGIDRTIARVNNPKNEAVLQSLGVDSTVSSTRVIFSLIQQEVALGGYVSSLSPLRQRGLEMAEIEIGEGSPVVGSKCSDLSLPESTSVLAVIRGEEAILSCKDSSFAPGDMLVLLTKPEDHRELRRILSGASDGG